MWNQHSYSVLSQEELVGHLFELKLFLAQRLSEAVDQLQFLRRLGQRVLLLDERTLQALLSVTQPERHKQQTVQINSMLSDMIKLQFFERNRLYFNVHTL